MGLPLFLLEAFLGIAVLGGMIMAVALIAQRLVAEQRWLVTGALLAVIGAVALLATREPHNYAPAASFVAVAVGSFGLASTLRSSALHSVKVLTKR